MLAISTASTPLSPPDRCREATPHLIEAACPAEDSDIESTPGGDPTGRRGAVASSLLAHAALLVLFAAIRWTAESPAPRPQLVSLIETEVTEKALHETAVLVEPSEAPASNELAVLPAAASEQPVIFAASSLSAGAPVTDAVPGEWLTAEIGDLGRSGSGAGDGDGNGDGAGNGAFFGIEIAGKRIAYIIDGSASMVEAFRRPERTRLGRVKRELIASIRSLGEDQKWFVVFFNSVAHPIPADRFISTEPREREMYLAWIDRFRPGGGTNPLPALNGTFSDLKPDVVFLLTDGEFSPQVIPLVDQLNRDEVVIHTVGLGDGTTIRDRPSLAARVLIELANRNSGEAKFIPDLPDGF